MADKNKALFIMRSPWLFLNLLAIFFMLLPMDAVYAARVCNTSPTIPTGHVVYRVIDGDSNCSRYYLTAQPSGTTTFACRLPHDTGYPLPDGYLIIGVEDRSDCNTFGRSPAYELFRPTGAGPYTVCSRSVLPDGYVIIERRVTNTGIDCDSSLPIKIRKPSSTGSTEICRGSPIPDGFVITGEGDDSRCRFGPNLGDSGPTQIIRVPRIGSVVCNTNNVPAGFGLLAVTASSCENNRGYRLVAPQDGARFCEPSAVPEGYVVTESGRFTECAGTLTEMGFEIHRPTNGTLMCSERGFAAVPDEYVVSRIVSRSVCRSGVAYRLQRPSLTQNTIACGNSSVPAGFAFSDNGTYSDCAVTGRGQGFIVSAIQAGGTYCSTTTEQIPSNMVVTAIDRHSQCDNGLGTTVNTPRPSGSEVCSTSPIPEGYVITARGSNREYGQCGTFGGFTIRLPSSNGETTVCGGSPIPVGYAVSSVVNYSQCGEISGGLGYAISRIDGPGPITVCRGTEVPEGYVITEQGHYSACAGNVTDDGFVIEVPDIDGETIMCGTATPPEGFVVVAFNEGSSCTSATGSNTIRLPDPNGETTICINSPIPAGFIVVSSPSRVSRCGDGPGSVIRPENDGSGGDGGGDGSDTPGNGGSTVNPQSFINTEPDVRAEDIPAVSFDCDDRNHSGGFLQSASTNRAACP